jgi:hypothetical protein
MPLMLGLLYKFHRVFCPGCSGYPVQPWSQVLPRPIDNIKQLLKVINFIGPQDQVFIYAYGSQLTQV